MRSRFPPRLVIALVGAWKHLTRSRLTARPAHPKRILIAHQLLLGDTILLTPLIAKLRRAYAEAEICLLVAPGQIALYAGRPYGVTVRAFDARSLASVAALIRTGGYDWALLPTENRMSWLARACGARWIAAFDGEPGRYKNWPIDEFRPFALQPKAWGELAAELADGAEPPPYRPADWPAPTARDFPLPATPYVLLHVGASTPLKQWPSDRWRDLAAWLADRGHQVVWSCGPGETHLIEAADPQGRFPRHAGDLDLAQLWQLLAHAQLIVCPDTGVTHIAHLAGTPSVVLYGPGNPALFGGGKFWREHREEVLFEPNFPCRDENLIFRRRLPWGEHCGRTPKSCAQARCMEVIQLAHVIGACERLLPPPPNHPTGAGS
jgi:ADP-heptose:LPS heptosyltransferase